MLYFECAFPILFIPLIPSADANIVLDLSGSRLTEVPPCPASVFAINLNLRGNHITDLHRLSFRNCEHLVEINLMKNRLRRINDGTFDNITSLETILLGDNIITKLPTDFGPSTTVLRKFKIASGVRDPGVFSYPYFSAFTNLVVLNTQVCGLGNLNDSFFPPNVGTIVLKQGIMDYFPPLSSLTPIVLWVSIPDHQIQSVSTEAVSGLLVLRTLLLQRNQIANFPDLSNLSKLIFLNLGSNRIKFIPREHIQGLKSLREMYIENNLLTNMIDISYLITLEIIQISYNQVEVIPMKFVLGLQNLKIFACDNNYLTSLPEYATVFPQLQELYVQGNNLKSLPDLFDVPSLAMLAAADNPYECNSSLCWIRMLPWMNQSIRFLQDEPRCDNPDSEAGLQVLRSHPTVMRCYEGWCDSPHFVEMYF